MLKISCAGCLGISPVISVKIHSVNVRRSLKSQKNHKKTILGVQGRSRSSVLVPPKSSSAVLVTISSKSVSICNRSHARRANSGKLTIYLGVPLFDALVR